MMVGEWVMGWMVRDDGFLRQAMGYSVMETSPLQVNRFSKNRL